MLLRVLLLVASFVAFGSARAAETSSPETIIKAYYAGWAHKNWDEVAGQLAPGFTFTSPAPDDHLPTDRFKAKCWNQADHIAGFEFPQIIGNDQEAFAIVHVITQEHRVIRNVEYFTFRDGKIRSIEVFFGGNGQGYPTNQK